MAHDHDHPTPMFSFAMLAAYVGVFAAQFKGADGIGNLHAYSWRLAQGETWRLITCTLMHASVIHLAFNAFWFVRFSVVIENWLGPWIALLLYAFFSAGSMAMQMLISSPLTMPIGASGAVYGLFGFLWVLRRRRDDAAEAVPVSVSQTMLAWLIVCAAVNHFGGNIANAAHVGGLGLGWGLGHAIVARRKWKPLIWTATILIGLALASLTYGPIWNATLGRMPVARRYFDPDSVPAELRSTFEHPPPDWEKAMQPGLF